MDTLEVLWSADRVSDALQVDRTGGQYAYVSGQSERGEAQTRATMAGKGKRRLK